MRFILLIGLILVPLELLAEKFLLPSYESSDKSYVKSVNIPGFERLNSKRGTWVDIPEGNYSGSIECVVNKEPMKVDVKFSPKDGSNKLYIFTADYGCGFVIAEQEK